MIKTNPLLPSRVGHAVRCSDVTVLLLMLSALPQHCFHMFVLQ
jgi:hypothetical protein